MYYLLESPSSQMFDGLFYLQKRNDASYIFWIGIKSIK
jgi:hypothetical protein